MSDMKSVDTNIAKLNEQKESMLKDAQSMYDNITAKAGELYQELKTAIEMQYQSHLSVLKQNHEQLNAVILRLESSLSDLVQIKGKDIDAKIFLRIQDTVNNTNQCKNDINMLNHTLSTASLCFVPSQKVQDFLSSSCTVGLVKMEKSQGGSKLLFPDILFPTCTSSVSTTRQPAHLSTSETDVDKCASSLLVDPQQRFISAESQSTGQHVPLTESAWRWRGGALRILQKYMIYIGPVCIVLLSWFLYAYFVQSKPIHAKYQGTYNVKLKDDRFICWITDIAITEDGRRLLADSYNRKVKMFSRDMKFLSSVSLVSYPWNIAVISDQLAVHR